jgi:hypothetical protein
MRQSKTTTFTLRAKTAAAGQDDKAAFQTAGMANTASILHENVSQAEKHPDEKLDPKWFWTERSGRFPRNKYIIDYAIVGHTTRS